MSHFFKRKDKASIAVTMAGAYGSAKQIDDEIKGIFAAVSQDPRVTALGDGLVLVSYTSQASIFIVSFYICDISSLRFIDVFAARCAPDYFGKPHFECV